MTDLLIGMMVLSSWLMTWLIFMQTSSSTITLDGGDRERRSPNVVLDDFNTGESKEGTSGALIGKLSILNETSQFHWIGFSYVLNWYCRSVRDHIDRMESSHCGDWIFRPNTQNRIVRVRSRVSSLRCPFIDYNQYFIAVISQRKTCGNKGKKEKFDV